MKSRAECVQFLKTKPYKYAHMLGFTKLTKLHNKWIKDFIRDDGIDTTKQAHRNSYKTTSVSVALALIIILRPNKRTLFMRKTDDDVKEIIQQVKNILLHPVTQYFVMCIYGVTITLNVNNSTEISTNLTTDIKGTSQLTGMGIKSSLTGKHYDYIFTDDIVNIEDRLSRAEREHTKQIYDELQNIKIPGGKITNTGTPWHPDDAFTKMPEPERYDCYSTGIMTKEEIAKKKKDLPASLFAANYELRHIASEDVIFSDPVLHGDPDKVQQARYSHIDAAYGGEDSTAFTICRKAEGKYYVYGKKWRKHVDDCLNIIRAEKARFNTRCILCETNADKGYLRKELEDQGERNVITYWEDMNKYLKIVTYLKGVWDRIVFVEGTDQEYIDEILEFNENAEHDDAPDSLASCIRQLWDEKDENDNVSYFGRF